MTAAIDAIPISWEEDQCQFCNFTNASKEELNRHVYITHLELVECTECGTYLNQDEFKKHKELVHELVEQVEE